MAPTVRSVEKFPAKTPQRRGPLARRGGDPNIREQPHGRNFRPPEVVITSEKRVPYYPVAARFGDDDHGPEIPDQDGSESSEPQYFDNVSRRHGDSIRRVERHTSDSKQSYEVTDSIPHENTQPSQLDDLLQRIFELEEENSQLKAHAECAPMDFIKPHAPLEPKWKTLYRIDRSNTYLDEPKWVLGDRKRLYMKAEMSVHNLALFIERNLDIAFIVYKDYNSKARGNMSACLEASNGVSRAPEAYAESLSFISDEMKSAMEQMIDQVPDFIQYFPDFKALEDVPAPYIFMYYAKQYWDECQSRLSTQNQRLLGLLKQCIMESYAAEYEAADGAFANGLVSRRYMKYLVRPGDVLVVANGSQISAFMSLDWIAEIDPFVESRDTNRKPQRVDIEIRGRDVREDYRSRSNSPSQVSLYETSSPSYWRVEAWSWEFNGSFAKTKLQFDIALPTYEEDHLVQINSLAVHPVRFADDEMKNRLERRGKTFWSCRRKQLVSYQVEAEEGLGAVSLLECLYFDTIFNPLTA